MKLLEKYVYPLKFLNNLTAKRTITKLFKKYVYPLKFPLNNIDKTNIIRKMYYFSTGKGAALFVAPCISNKRNLV